MSRRAARTAVVAVLSLVVGFQVAGLAGADPPVARPTGAQDPTPTAAHDLEVTIETRNQRGAVFCALWRSADGFPVDSDRASHEAKRRPAPAGPTSFRFESVPPGEYAIACFHDENDNAELDTNFLGIPSEGTGASNDAYGLFGPPRYEDARFRVSAAGPRSVSIQLHY